jgi:hypothetical protein
MGVAAFVRLREAAWSMSLEGAFDAPTSKRDRFAVSASAYGATGALVPCVHMATMGLCGLAELGVLHARAAGSGTSAVASLGVRLATEVPLGPQIAARFHGDVVAPLARTTLRVDDEDLWTAPLIATRLGIGLVYRF